MKYFKEFSYGVGLWTLHVVLGLASNEFGIFLVSGTILSVITVYTLCRLKEKINPIGIDYNLGAINGFDRVNITMFDSKYIIGFMIDNNPFVELNGFILGGYSFLKVKNELKEDVYFKNYEDCIKVIEKRTIENFANDLEKTKSISNYFLIKKNDCIF